MIYGVKFLIKQYQKEKKIVPLSSYMNTILGIYNLLKAGFLNKKADVNV